jgi:tetratricopeptide (TPR) repeat protein
LRELRRLLTQGKGPAVISQTITGLGGIGKTQTALAYCYRHLADYRLIWWLRAESAATLSADFATLAEPLGLDPTAADQEKLLSSIRTALQANDRWLLVLDNVEDPELPRRYLPSTGSGHVLITSRRTDWHGLARALPLEVLPEPQAVQLLCGDKDPATLSAAEQAEAKALARDLGCLPLALAQSRAYIAERGRSFAGYRKLLQASRPVVLAKGRASPDYPASVARTWQVSMEAAEAACAGARPLLELLAFFAPEALPTELLAADDGALPPLLRGELDRDEAVGALNRFSLIRAEAGTITVHRLVQAVTHDGAAEGMITVHRLVQAVTRDGLDAATAEARVAVAVKLVAASLPRPPWNYAYWPIIQTRLPHALSAASEAERLASGLEAAGEVLDETGMYLAARGSFGQAEEHYQRAIAIFKKFGSEHPGLGLSLALLANLRCDTGCYVEVEWLYKCSIKIGEKTLGLGPNLAKGPYNFTSHDELAKRLHCLALFYKGTGRLEEAKPLFERSIHIFEENFRLEHPDRTGRRDDAKVFGNHGIRLQDAGRYAEAEPLLRRAVKIDDQRETSGPAPDEVANRRYKLGKLLLETGRHTEAEPLLKRALKDDEKGLLDPEHYVLADRLNGLAELYRATGRYAEAEPLYLRTIAIGEKALGPEHPKLAKWLNNLALLYRATGRYAEAEPLYLRTIAIGEKALGPEHPILVSGLNNLAALYRDTGRYTEAEPLYARTLTIIEKALPRDHPYRRSTRESYALLLDQLGRGEEAAALRAQAAAARPSPGPPEPGGSK